MGMKLLVDSASDISQAEALEMGIEMLPMTIQFGMETYQDGITLSGRAFFEKLIESDELPKTSQINVYQFEKRFSEMTADGSDVVAITLSSKLSGTYSSAMQAAKRFEGKVWVVDSLNACIGERLLVQRALRLAEAGLSAEECACQLEKDKSRVKVMALLDTLEYLLKGGRISAAMAVSGTMLHIKPVVEVVDGEVKLVGKAIGSRKGNNLLKQLIQRSGGIDFSMPFATAYSGLEDSMLQKYLADSREIWSDSTEQVPIHVIGSTIGTHVGPGAIAVAFFAGEK